MYSEWKSLQSAIQTDDSNISVLHSFPDTVGKDVAGSVVKHLAQNLSLGVSNSEPSKLNNDKEVKWTMEVLCYGLNLPLSELDTIKDCVNVYCDWMTALVTPKACVPKPVKEEPNKYAQDMLHHLYNLFAPRDERGTDLVKRQAVHCHRVLRTVQHVANDSTIMTRETWETLLKFLLAINDTLLATPTVKVSFLVDDIGDQLCERVLSVLFELWLLACAKCFPAPSLWKTFRDMSSNWRHHEALVIQWHRVNAILTSKLIKFMYGPEFPELAISEDDYPIIPADMDRDCVAQSWFRFLHVINNPVDMCRPHVISQTQKFLHMALTSEAVIEPSQHECLAILPQIFFRAMRGISVLVDAFLGISQSNRDDALLNLVSRQTATITSSTPPPRRADKKSTGSQGGKSQKSVSTPKLQANTTLTPSNSPGHVTLESLPPLAPARPKCNSILHLFGAWLVEAAIAGVKVHGNQSSNSVLHMKLKRHLSIPPSRRTSFINESDNVRRRSMPLDAMLKLSSSHGEILVDNYEAGRAEACGALCRIFCAHKTGEDILPVYLSRFYIAMHYGLRVSEPENFSSQVLANILFNSPNLLRVDLDGVMVLVPQMLDSLELVLSDTLPKINTFDQIPQVELRKASIHLLLSMICLPLHFKDLQIKPLIPNNDMSEPTRTFLSLKMRLIELLMKALTIEADPANTHLLLGGLLLIVQDLANCETAEQTTLQQTHDLLSGPEPETSSIGSGSSNKPTSLNLEGESGLKTKDFDTSYGLFGGAASLVCNRLMATWKTDLNIALSAMEVLSGLAKVHLNTPNHLMCKRTVKWICDFIVYQCSRPPPAHSRDLHSMIVAAFQCLTLWLVEHHYLLQDKECLHYVLEVVELGISGSKSQNLARNHESMTLKIDKDSKSVSMLKNRASDVPKMKGEKELMPASMRVRDAAELVLTTIMEQVGSFPPPCGPESPYSLLDEDSLLRYCRGGSIPEHGFNFRYFVLENSIIIGLLEQPLGNEQDPLPTVTAIVRGPFGRHAWTMQLRHLPRHHKVASKAYLSDPGRPQPRNDIGKQYNIRHRYFPDMVEKIPLTNADKSIPPLESVVPDNQQADHEKLKHFIEKQAELEAGIAARVKKEKAQREFPDSATECKPPTITHEFQTARLFLAHYGFLSLEALKEPTNSSIPPPLSMLNHTQPGYLSALEALDSIPSRTNDTAYVFYVKAGQKTAPEILSNVLSEKNVQSHFMEFLLALGWPVDVKKHAGWTGNPVTSWKIIEEGDEGDPGAPSNTGGSLYDGRKQVLYWADASSEVVFIVPSPDTYHERRRASLDSVGVTFRFQSSDRTTKTLDCPIHISISTPNFGETSPTQSQRKIYQKIAPQTWATGAEMSRRLRDSPPNSSPVCSPTLRQHARLRHENGEVDRTSHKSWSPLLQRLSLVPSHHHVKQPQGEDGDKSPVLSGAKGREAMKPKSLSLDLDAPPKTEKESPSTPTETSRGLRKIGRTISNMGGPDTKVFIVWVESFEDGENIPINDLVCATNPQAEKDNVTSSGSSLASQTSNKDANICVILIHSLKSGLFRIGLQGHSGRISMAGPLVDGMVVSRRTLGALVRQTAINLCRRKRLESEVYQPPHVRRKLRIQEITNKFRSRMNEPEFYTALFQDTTK
ncbi:ral GTPase-activating protein subunit beta-like isoform X2 [Lineus longissimus]|uniref:ral GTPase-activating protein subunit beta-like isoform X2 n=1 Tax=Lineus longissimus TaxID=88925 RepID=UPI00315D49A2